MPRKYNRKSDRGQYTLQDINLAVHRISGGEKIRKVAQETGIDKSSLCRYVKKYRESGNQEIQKVGYWGIRQVFDDNMEKKLCEYLKNSARMYFGLTPTEVRRLAYELSVKNNLNVPFNWLENSMAGEDWLRGFLSRHKSDVAVRLPEPTSIARASSFNEKNVGLFYLNLSAVKERSKFQAKDIWNVDETGCTTVQKPPKVIAETGTKQVGAITSSERGQLVTICCAVNAVGQALPPMFVFPRVHFRDHFIRDAPAGSAGSAHPSGWMTAENFVRFLQHFVNQVTRPIYFYAVNFSTYAIIAFYCNNNSNLTVQVRFHLFCHLFLIFLSLWHRLL